MNEVTRVNSVTNELERSVVLVLLAQNVKKNQNHVRYQNMIQNLCEFVQQFVFKVFTFVFQNFDSVLCLFKTVFQICVRVCPLVFHPSIFPYLLTLGYND